MNYEQTLDYLYQTLPMFQRVGSAAYKENLDNTIALCLVLGNPQNKFRSVHVAGTNGKGSSSHMLAAILQSAGYKTGLYTSPHLKAFTERIRINGKEIGQAAVVDFVSRVKPALESIHPSFFETTVAMAFDYFVSEGVDIAIVEVGLGGRLDSTNVITPLVSLITNIGYDHTDLLGKELTQIAGEKAGIIKPSIPVVVSERQTTVEPVFINRAEALTSPISFATDHYRIEDRGDPGSGQYDVYRDDQLWLNNLTSELKGTYQKRNIPGVLLTVDQLSKMNYSISDTNIRHGIGSTASMTGLKGRWQIIGKDPMVICDTGHNTDGIKAVVSQIQMTPHAGLHIVLGMVGDKDIGGVLAILPKVAHYYFCQAKIPRALPAMDLAAQAGSYGLQGHVVADVNDAIRDARANAAPEDLIFIGGSTFVVAEVDGI